MTSPITFKDLPFHRLTPDGFKKDLKCATEAQILVMEAEAMGIQWEVIPFSIIVKLTYGTHTEYMRGGTTSTNRVPGPYICADKYQTRAVLTAAGIPMTKGFSIKSADTAEDRAKIFNALKTPLVVKPANATHGVGVKMGISTLEEMNAWIDTLLSTVEQDIDNRDGMVLVEETAAGDEYRMIVTREKLIAVMNRQPASVIGDGSKTIRQLIDKKNEDPMRNVNEKLYPHIKIDEDMLSILRTKQLTPDSVPGNGQKVVLRMVSNVAAGGDAYDMTDEVHPSVAELAVRVINAIPGMALVGIDYMTTNITNDQQFEQHNIIEVNSAPEYDMHDYPMHGKKRGVARTILQMMFPEWREPAQS